MADPGAAMAVAAALILLGVLASKVSDRLGVPALLLLLGIGMLAGSEGVGGIDFDDFEAAQAVGVVALVLATFPLVEGLPQADLIFDVVFFTVIASVLVQGTAIPVVARWLGVDTPLRQRRPHPLEYVESGDGTTDLHEIEIPESSPAVGRQLVDLHLPQGTLVVLVSRADEFVVPQGSTVLLAGDMVLLLTDERSLPEARALIEGLTG